MEKMAGFHFKALQFCLIILEKKKEQLHQFFSNIMKNKHVALKLLFFFDISLKIIITKN